VWRTLSALVPLFGLTACIPLPTCPPVSPLEAAAGYDWLPASRQYSEPLNAWVKNERLEKFLLKTFRAGGVDALKSQFGVECEPRPLTPACRDCYVCRGKLSKQVAPQEDEPFEYRCSKSGEMLVQMDIGPGREAFSVMTYWKRPPLRADAGKS
jgi:DNA polymerase III epsilon subunit-like protein